MDQEKKQEGKISEHEANLNLHLQKEVMSETLTQAMILDEVNRILVAQGQALTIANQVDPENLTNKNGYRSEGGVVKFDISSIHIAGSQEHFGQQSFTPETKQFIRQFLSGGEENRNALSAMKSGPIVTFDCNDDGSVSGAELQVPLQLFSKHGHSIQTDRIDIVKDIDSRNPSGPSIFAMGAVKQNLSTLSNTSPAINVSDIGMTAFGTEQLVRTGEITLRMLPEDLPLASKK